MMNAKEFKDWANSLDDEDQVYIDDGGLTICVVGHPEVYSEIGGEPLEDDDEATD